jgi:hypothetical protein
MVSPRNNNKRKSKRNFKAANKQSQPRTQLSGALPTAPITTIQKQRAAVPMARPRQVSDYMHCRLSPFTHTGASYIPDGSAARRITKEIRMFYDITIGSSGGFIMMGIPELPRGVVFKDIQASPSTGVLVGAQACYGGQQGPNAAGAWYGPVMPDWATWSTTNPNVEVSFNPWYAAKIRIVTQAYRMMYTGQSLSCAGTITVSENEIGINNTYAPNIAAITEYNAASAADPTTWPAGTVMHTPAVIQSSTNVLNASSVVLPVAQGAYFVLGRNNNNCTWTDAQQMFLLTEGKTVAMMAFVPGGALASSAAYDSNFTPKMAVVAGMTPGTTMRVEMMMCVEFEPDMGSVFREFARVPTKQEPTAIAKTEQVLSKLPVAGPLSWTNTIIDYAVGAVKVGKAIAAAL